MSIYGIQGTPGAGKSLFAVSKILAPFIRNCEKAGTFREIYHNIDGLNVDVLCNLCGAGLNAWQWVEHIHQLDVDDNGDKDNFTPRFFWLERGSVTFETYPDLTDGNKVKRKAVGQQIAPGSLVILDEVQNIYSSRNTLTCASDEMKDFITKHRHYKITLFWMSQHVEQVDVSFRRNTEQIWKLERRENVAFTKAGKNSAVLKKFLGWDNTEMMTPIATEKFTYDSRFYATYKSYDCGAEELGEEQRQTTNIWLHSKGLWVCAVLFLVCMVALFVSGNPLEGMTAGMRKHSTTPTKPQPTTPAGVYPPVGVGVPGVNPATVPNNEQNKIVCYESTYKINGGLYFIRNGETLPFERGVIYEKCK